MCCQSYSSTGHGKDTVTAARTQSKVWPRRYQTSGYSRVPRHDANNRGHASRRRYPDVHSFASAALTCSCSLSGVRKIYKGLPPALVRQVIKSGFQMSIYTHIRSLFTPEGMNSKDIALWRKSMSAMTAGIVGQFIANPCDIIKV